MKIMMFEKLTFDENLNEGERKKMKILEKQLKEFEKNFNFNSEKCVKVISIKKLMELSIGYTELKWKTKKGSKINSIF